MGKVHYASTRLHNNAGMQFPLCRQNDRLLDLSLRVKFGRTTEVTCKNCLRMIEKDWFLRKQRDIDRREDDAQRASEESGR